MDLYSEWEENMNLDSLELSNVEFAKLDVNSLNLMGEYLLIMPFKKKEIKGFILPENNKEKPTVGKVIKVGNGQSQEKAIPMIIAENDIVMFKEWSAQSLEELKFNGEVVKLFYLKQSDVIGFFSDQKSCKTECGSIKTSCKTSCKEKISNLDNLENCCGKCEIPCGGK